jgi:hypothetical protein
MRTSWLKAALILAALWIVVGGIIWLARSARPTPDSVAKYADTHPVTAGQSAAEREKIMKRLAEQLNQLDYEQRREVRMGHRVELFFKSLTPAEQSEFIDLTFPAGFRQMMEAFNKMPPQRRKAFVDRTLKEMQSRGDQGGDLPPDDPNRKKIVEQGLQAFYSDASAETKMDLAPLMEEMQRSLQGLR